MRSAYGWRDRAMRGMGYILTVCMTTICVALSLNTGYAISADQSATQPIDGLYAQGTVRQRGTSGTDLSPPALPPVCSSCSCSTFMLRTDDAFLIGHNLDNGRAVPGTIVINKRNVQKTGVSLLELMYDVEPPNPAIAWTSRYGSATFNAWGKEFIDGGINEVGLYIHEMSLLGTRFPEDDERPRMFMMQWMQYQLDNYATVEEVVSNLSTIVLDGWFWHFFISDGDGNSAAIEFVDGVLNVYTGDSMPIPVLCNTAYPEELANLERYAGFGGEQPVRLRDKSTERFVHAAHMIQDAPQSVDADYGFKILKTLERGLTHWSIVIDANQARVYFRTSLGKKIKFFDMARFDFSSETPVKMLDINARLSGDVFEYFVDYSPERNLRAAKEGIESTDSVEQGLSRPIEPYGYTLDDLIDRACAAANGGSCATSPAGAETAGGVDAIAADALSKPSQARNWILLPLGAVLALLLSVSLLLVHRNRRRPPEETDC
ncbi:MAG TPA: linear amide C-N hydrolase [Anaerolineales bacterium]|nr:linear amide C-N hydrolase [Anaerolineales bacterium]